MESQRLGVAGVDVEEEECPRPMHNFTLPPTSPFSYSPSSENNITYFYNCTSGYPKDVAQHLPCLAYYNINTITTQLRFFVIVLCHSSSPTRISMADRRRILEIETKTFEVSTTGDGMEIVEKSQGGWNTYIRFATQVGVWIAKLFSGLQKKRDGFIGRMRERDMVVVINKRRNFRGGFISLVFVSQRFKRGCKTIIVPEGDGGSGWKGFNAIMESVLDREDDRTIVEQVLSIEGFENRVEPMGKSAVVAVMENTEKWKRLPEDLEGIFALCKKPVINQIGTKTFLLNMGNEKDANLLLKVPFVRLAEGITTIKQWSSSATTMPVEWLQTQDRWIELDGIPMHLRETEVVQKICKSFGKIKQMYPVTNGVFGPSSMRVLISMCDLTLMSHVIILKDQLVSYPVRTRLVEKGGVKIRGRNSGREDDSISDCDRPVNHAAVSDFEIQNPLPGEVSDNQDISYSFLPIEMEGKDLIPDSPLSTPTPFTVSTTQLSKPANFACVSPLKSHNPVPINFFFASCYPNSHSRSAYP